MKIPQFFGWWKGLVAKLLTMKVLSQLKAHSNALDSVLTENIRLGLQFCFSLVNYRVAFMNESAGLPPGVDGIPLHVPANKFTHGY